MLTINHIEITVAGLSEAIAWYQDAFMCEPIGMPFDVKITEHSSGPSQAKLLCRAINLSNGAGPLLRLVQYPPSQADNEPPADTDGPAVIAWETTNIEIDRARLAAIGATFFGPTIKCPTGPERDVLRCRGLDRYGVLFDLWQPPTDNDPFH